MSNRLVSSLFLLTLCIIFPITILSIDTDSRLLLKLDSLISESDKMEGSRIRSINEIRHKRNNTQNKEEKYLYNNLLYEAYYCFNADSAMKYLNDNIKLVADDDTTDRLTDLKIKKSFLLTASGMFNEAQDIMNGINSNNLSHNLKKEYFGQMIYLYGLLGNYSGLSRDNSQWNQYYDIEQIYKDSLIKILSPEDKGYLWYKGWSAQGMTGANQDSVLNMLKNAVDNSSLNSREDAQNAYVLAILYKERGERERFLEYLTKSAIADVKIGNREIASLQELASNMFESGDIDRAYSYLNYSLDAALKYPNRVRALTLLPIQEEINRAYQLRNKKHESQTRGFLISLCLVAGILVVAIIFNFIQMKKLKQINREAEGTNNLLHSQNSELELTRNQLADTNSKLKELNSKLKTVNERLREANYVKEEYVGYVFSICSLYIKKMEELRNSINVKIKKKQWTEIEEMTSNHQSMVKAELKEFYDNFDSIFLHIYPDFVNDFNSLLQPGERITLKEGELLNTDLRIYALVRLGINDSVKIADFLHCSPQTVYNYRFKMRGKALGSKEHFLEAVKNIGKAEFNN